jgi:hypothetical protein
MDNFSRGRRRLQERRTKEMFGHLRAALDLMEQFIVEQTKERETLPPSKIAAEPPGN